MPDFHVDVDTSGLMFDVNSPDFLERIREEIPAFKEFKAQYAASDPARERIYALCVLLYDINTPLRRKVKGLYDRKVYAANIVGLKPNKSSGKFKEYVEDILAGADRPFNELVGQYISFQASAEYTQLVAHSKIQYDLLQKIISNKADQHTQKMFDLATEKIKELTRVLYGTGQKDEVYEARRALYKQVAYDLTEMMAENVARRYMETGTLPESFNPYEEDYVPDDIHFIGDDPDIALGDEEALP